MARKMKLFQRVSSQDEKKDDASDDGYAAFLEFLSTPSSVHSDKREQQAEAPSNERIASASSSTADASSLSSRHSLSKAATEALEDLRTILGFLGKEELDREAFETLLDDIVYKRSKEGLYQSLLEDVAAAGGSVGKKSISIEDMANLYASESYHLLDSGMDLGHALMKFAGKLFKEADMNGDGYIQVEEVMNLVTKMSGNKATEAEAQELIDLFDLKGSGSMSLADFKAGILKPNKNESFNIPRTFDSIYLLPTHTTPNEFVDRLEEYAENHRAVTHHFLENISCASFGTHETAELILTYFRAYCKFNSGFVDNLTQLIVTSTEGEKEILEENLREEMGMYDDETLEKCDQMGISRESIVDIPHRELFLRFIKIIESKVQCPSFDFSPEDAGDVMESMANAQMELKKYGKIGLLSSLYFGSEFIVPLLYSSFLSGLKLSLSLTNQEAAFLHLHIDMDCDHAESLKNIILSYCSTMDDRMAFVHCTEIILNARVASYDAMGQISCTGAVVDRRRSLQRRDSLSGLNCRPLIYGMIEEQVKGAKVLDVGCGEGVTSRYMAAMGASKVVGIDISSEMIVKAREHPDKSHSEYYVTGDSTSLKNTLADKSSEVNIMLGSQFDAGSFDLSVAVSLFNYMSISDMIKTIEEVFTLLKPSGNFIFSVPHPFISPDASDGKYFALRDKWYKGTLNQSMQFKTIEDYIKASTNAGFIIAEVKEARVNALDLLENRKSYQKVAYVPLHLIIKLRKPEIAPLSTPLNLLPQKINWSKTLTKNIDKSIIVDLPSDVNIELVFAALSCYNTGIDIDRLDIGRDVIRRMPLKATIKFARTVRKKLVHDTGAVLVKGLNMDAFGGVPELEKMTQCSKISFLIFCECVGSVDSTARGKLFDVKNANIDSSKTDNTLFSVSNTKAGWHTDGASVDRAYDIVSLLCISPAAKGGKLRISNACDVYDGLNGKVPKFLMYELTRSIPRDVLENGNGKGTAGVASSLSRSSALLSMRIKYNSYPIYAVDGNRMRFRYMRHWIETGHHKAFWRVPTLLRIAMDVLDDCLDDGCCFNEVLSRGDMIFTNNSLIAHARDQFEDTPGVPPRHKVRAWIQVLKSGPKEAFYKKVVEHGATSAPANFGAHLLRRLSTSSSMTMDD